jgi:hypothetical protein
MTGSKDQILARIRAAAAAGGRPDAGVTGGPAGGHARARADADADADAAYAALPREYLRAHHDAAAHDITDLFAERAADYRAVVERVPEPALAPAIARVLGERVAAAPGAILVPDGLPDSWLAGLPAAITLTRDEPPLSAAELDRAAGVVTGCAVAIAETGTIILDHGPGSPWSPTSTWSSCGPARSPPTWPARSPGSTRPARTPSSPAPRPPATSSSSGSRACTARATCTSSWRAPIRAMPERPTLTWPDKEQ